MKEIVIISGKGGTGKTTITASFASLADNKVICDCDVDAANLHLLLGPDIIRSREISTQKLAGIKRKICTECGICEKNCHFNAIHDLRVNPLECEGCGLCYYLCPEDAIEFKSRNTAKIYEAETRYGPFFYGKLYPGAGTSGKVVTEVRNSAVEHAERNSFEMVIIDGSPGIGCPVIASMSGCDIAVVVTEPTLSGEHDLERIVNLAEYFGVETFVCVNKYDINIDITEAIEKWCKEKDIKVASKIPYDSSVTESIVAGMPVVDYCNGEVKRSIEELWNEII